MSVQVELRLIIKMSISRVNGIICRHNLRVEPTKRNLSSASAIFQSIQELLLLVVRVFLLLVGVKEKCILGLDFRLP